MPFNVKIPDDKQDKSLPDRLRNELSGILRWAVQGCLDWQREGLGTPPEVTKATAGYQAERDVLAEFLDDSCVIQPTATVTVKELFEIYTEWCKSNGEDALGKRALGSRLRERGFHTFRGTGGARTWQGIGLLGMFE